MADIRVDANRLNAMMMLRGVDDARLAQKLGITSEGVRQLKKRQSTSLAGIKRLCRALACSPHDLLVIEGYPEPMIPGATR